jgi:hypothetical protein
MIKRKLFGIPHYEKLFTKYAATQLFLIVNPVSFIPTLSALAFNSGISSV